MEMSIEDKTIKQLSNSIKVLQKANSEIAEAYDKLKADYENRLKTDLVAILTEIQLEIEEQSLTHSEDNILSEWGLGYNHSVERCGELIQQKIDKCKAESEERK